MGKSSLLLGAWTLIASAAMAQETGTAARLGMGARPLALGGAFVAIPDDASSVSWNPASLTTLVGTRVELHYRRLSSRHSMDAGSVVFAPPRHRLVYGLSLNVLRRAGVAAGDALGGFVGEAGAHEVSGQLHLGLRVAPGLSLGVGGGPILSSLQGRHSGWGGSAGMLWSHGSTSVGFGILGVTAGLGSVEVPQPYRYRLSTGVAQRWAESVLVSLQLDRDRGADPAVAAGVEWSVIPQAALRAGYREAWGDDAVRSFGHGIGVRQGRFELDYAVLLGRASRPEHLLSLRFRFDPAHESMPLPTADRVEDTAPPVAEPVAASSSDQEADAPTPQAEPIPATTAMPGAPDGSHEEAAPPPAVEPRSTLPVGLREPGPPPGSTATPRPRPEDTRGRARAAPVADPTRTRYVVRAGVHEDMDEAALEIARFYRARIRPDLERRGELYIVVVRRCDSREEAESWVQRAREAGLRCTIDEE